MHHRHYAKSVSIAMLTLLLASSLLSLAEGTREGKLLHKQAQECIGRNKLKEAIPLLERAVSLDQRAVGADHPVVADHMYALASAYGNLGRHNEARRLLEKVLPIAENVLGAKSAAIVPFLGDLASAYEGLGLYSEALPLHRKVLGIVQEIFGRRSAEAAGAARDLAVTNCYLGNYNEAIELNNAALKIQRSVLGAKHIQVAYTLENLAIVYASMSEYAEALSLYENALDIKISKQGADSPDAARTYHNIATAYLDIGSYAKSVKHYLKALAIREKVLEPANASIGLTLSSLGAAYIAAEDYTNAQNSLERALNIQERLTAESVDVASTLFSLAVCHEKQRDLHQAISLYNKVLNIDEKTSGPNHRNTAQTLAALGSAYIKTSENEKGREYLERSVRVLEENLGIRAPLTTAVLDMNGKLAFVSGDVAKARSFALKAINGRDVNMTKVFMLDEVSRTVAQKSSSSTWYPNILGPQENAELSLRWKGAVLESIIKDRALLAAARGNKAVQKMVDTIEEEKIRLSRVAFSKSCEAESSRLEERISTLQRQLARKLYVKDRGDDGLDVSVDIISSVLGENAVLIDFITYTVPDGIDSETIHYGAIMTRGKREPIFVQLVDTAEVDRVIDHLRTALSSGDAQAIEEQTQALSEKLWQPIAAHLPANTKRLFICPDSSLNFVSFAGLLESDGDFVAEKRDIVYLGSGRDLLRKQSAEVAKEVSVFADPVFDTSGAVLSVQDMIAMRSAEADVFGAINLVPLPGTKAEAEQLEVIAAGAGWDIKTTTGDEATESNVRGVKKPGVLHLATHGFYLNSFSPPAEDGMRGMSVVGLNTQEDKKRNENGVDPMRASGVALTGAQQTLKLWSQRKAPDPETDGILTAEEVAVLDLEGTWLVTLSACETGVGEARSGEGVFGLRRAFMIAGAENLLMTLWPVADDTTASIMADFYKEALATGDAPGSLAKVQRDWLVKLREEKGLAAAIREAGPFAMVAMVNPSQSVSRFSAGAHSAVPINAVSPSQPVISLEMAEVLADSSDAYAQAVLAIMYTLGYGTTANEEQAKHYVMASAKSRNPLGIYWLSFMRTKGIGMEKNATQAKQLQNQAFPALQAMSDDPYALYALARIEQQSNRDSKKATDLMKRSADLGFAPAQLDYAASLLKQTSDPEVKAEAKKYWDRARDQQYSQALQTPFPP